MQAVLCEFESEADHFLKYARETGLPPADQLVVGLTPAVRAGLQTRGIPCHSTLNFFDTASHRRIVMELERVCRLLQDKLSIPDGYAVEQAYKESLIFYTRLFLAHLMIHIEMLHRVDEQFRVDRWVACLYEKSVRTDVNPLVRPAERYVGELTRAFAARRGRPCVELKIERGPAPSRAGQPGSHLLSRLMAYVSFRLYRKLSSGRAALVSNMGYEMDTLVKEISDRHPGLAWFWIDASPKEGSFIELKKTLKRFARIFFHGEKGPFLIPLRILKSAVKIPPERARSLSQSFQSQLADLIRSEPERFCFRDISLADGLTQKWREDIVPAQIELYHETLTLQRLLTGLNPRFVLSQTSGDVYSSLGELSASMGIPAMLISHGSSVPAKEEEARIEHDHISRRLLNSTYPFVALQSPWASKFAAEMAVRSRPLLTGPLIWTRLKNGARSEETRERIKHAILPSINGKTKIVLHASTPRSRDSHHFYICEYPDEYIQSVQDILEAVERTENCVLLVRFRPRIQFSADDLRRLLPKSDRLVVSVGEKFSEALSVADLLVSFYSATVEEAIHNRIPVLLYGGRGRYMQLPATVIDSEKRPDPSAAYFVSDKQYLTPAIRHILQIHDGRPLDQQLIRPHCFQQNELVLVQDLVGTWMSRA